MSGKFVEFFGPGVSQLSIGDRTTIANMCPEYGAILSFFPIDNVTLKHLKHTGKTEIKTAGSPELYHSNILPRGFLLSNCCMHFKQNKLV